MFFLESGRQSIRESSHKFLVRPFPHLLEIRWRRRFSHLCSTLLGRRFRAPADLRFSQIAHALPVRGAGRNRPRQRHFVALSRRPQVRWWLRQFERRRLRRSNRSASRQPSHHAQQQQSSYDLHAETSEYITCERLNKPHLRKKQRSSPAGTTENSPPLRGREKFESRFSVPSGRVRRFKGPPEVVPSFPRSVLGKHGPVATVLTPPTPSPHPETPCCDGPHRPFPSAATSMPYYETASAKSRDSSHTNA